MLFFSCACMRIALARKSAFCSCFIQFHVLLPVSFITSGHRRIPARVILHCVHRFPFMQLLCTTHVRIDTLIIAFHLPPSRVRAFVLVLSRCSLFLQVPSQPDPSKEFSLLLHLLHHIWPPSSLSSLHCAPLLARACDCPVPAAALSFQFHPSRPFQTLSCFLHSALSCLLLSFCLLLHIWSALSHSSLASLHAAALYHAHTRASTLRSVLSNNGVLLDVNARAA
mmetsp:Transcript_12288/g.31884  ORF Transcript_12288/g.31884 Transcript_12288/m.31884 type:complete len:225 (-) Transcript_12288:525-1199(-)